MDQWQDHELVFPSMIGTPLLGDRLIHEFPALAKMTGLPVIIVAGRQGYSISILLEIYKHFIPIMQDEAAQLKDNILI